MYGRQSGIKHNYIRNFVFDGDMSNDKGGEKPPRRKPKVSCATLIDAGLVGTLLYHLR